MSDPSHTLSVMTRPHTVTHLLKGSEVRDLLHIGKSTLHDWRTRGEIHGIQHKPGPRHPWYYPADQPVIERALRAVGSLR